METAPAIDRAVDYFDAHTAELYPDVRDRVAHTIVDIRSGEGSTVRFHNAAEGEFTKLRTDRVIERFQPLFDEKPMGVRHAENGRLYAIVENTDKGADEENETREALVGSLPFADVQAGPDCEFGRRISAVAVDYGPAAVTVSPMAPFAGMVTATRPYADGEADGLL